MFYSFYGSSATLFYTNIDITDIYNIVKNFAGKILGETSDT